MSGYLFHFIVYAMAMTGIIFLAIFTYKFAYGNKIGMHSSSLSVTDSMKLTPKKTLYVVKAGEEKFLIASDFDSTTLISKLDNNDMTEKLAVKTPETSYQTKPVREDKSMKLSNFDGLKSMNDFINQFEDKKSAKKPVMKELARKLQSC
ncbi:FliO/MopB family protein [bacterium]|nr:FliO/MopB family protein [bacterium]